MTAEQIIGLSLALFVMCFGLAGSVLPGIPSTPLVMLVAIGHRLWFGAAGASNLALIILGLLMVASLVMDYLASMYGAGRPGCDDRPVRRRAGQTGLLRGDDGVVRVQCHHAIIATKAGGGSGPVA